MSRNLWNQKVNYQPYQPHPLSSMSVLILCHFSIGLSVSDFSLSKACKHFYSLPCVLQTPPFACHFISSNHQYLVKSTNQQAVLPSLPLLPLSKDARRIFLITLLSATLTLFPSLSVRKIASHHYRTNTQNSDLHVFITQIGRQ